MKEECIEYKILKFLEEQGDLHSLLESFNGLLGVSVNLYMASMDDDRIDPLTFFTDVIKEALKNYEKIEND